MSRLRSFYKKNRSYVAVFLIYNYFWYIYPVQTIIVNSADNWFKSAFVAVTAIPGMTFMVYHYLFRYYIAVLFGGYLINTLIFRKSKKTQHLVSLILIIIYVVLYFYVVRLDVNEFPFPRVT